jgi:hypothetical protein
MKRMQLFAAVLILVAFGTAGVANATKTTLEFSAEGGPVAAGEPAYAAAYETDVNTSLGDVKCVSHEENDLFFARDLTNNLPTDSIEVERAGGVFEGQSACESESRLGKHAFVSIIGNDPLGTITMSTSRGGKMGKAAFKFTSGAEVRTVFLETESDCRYSVKSLKGEVFLVKFGHFGMAFKETKLKLIKSESTPDCATKAGLFFLAIRMQSRSPREEWTMTEL